MIGNDIVDFQLSRKESNWKRRGFMQKILTWQEAQYVDKLSNEEDQEQLVWLFWSMKEAAYKIFMRQVKRRFFSPKKFKCTLDQSFVNKIKTKKIHGQVRFDNQICNTWSEINKEYIYTIATYKTQNNLAFAKQETNAEYLIYNKVFHSQHSDQKSQSSVARQKLISSISEQFDSHESEIAIKKDALSVPRIFIKSKLTKVSCSITHHGRYSGICFQNN